MHQSIATIDSPEFINLQPLDLNPLMSSCEIKVLYLGQNRNHSYITKDVATEMSKTLRGAPIVGYYREEKGDFADHGEKITFDDQGVHFQCMTKPYGFVAPDAKVWFQKFEDFDDFGNSVTREYLMTTGFLWTGQFEECKSAVEEGKPHSMELDESTLDGKWSTDTNSGMDFFIINDAIFSKLCILGDDVEPCFEGSSVTAPKVSSSFSLDDTFKNTLFNMMQDLKDFALQGGQTMDNLDNVVTEAAVEETSAVEATVEETTTETQNFTEETPSSEDPVETDFKKEDEEDKKEKEEKAEDKPADSKPAEEKPADKEDDEDKKKPAKNSLEDEQKYAELESKYTALEGQYAELEGKYNELVAFKASIEDAKKDELINSFYMLSDEDKKDVIENKSKYSYDDIEAKLSVICVRKKVNFDLENTSENEDIVESKTPAMTFNLNNDESSVPAFVMALKNAREKNL